MANDFSKNEVVLFEKTIENFEDSLIMSRHIDKYEMEAVSAERQNDITHIPMPYIAQTYDGRDQSANFGSFTQLSVPAQVDTWKSGNFRANALERRDESQISKYSRAIAHKLASDVNIACMNMAANEGTLVIKRTSAASGFDDVAKCRSIMNRVGITHEDRKLALSTDDYNGMASNLAGRESINDPKALKAYEEAYIGKIASFETFSLDYANRLAAKGGTTVTINGANQYHTPKATDTNKKNVDNRYQNIEVTVSSGAINVGDCFTIADVYEVHHITKQSTGNLKTFRVVAVPDGGTTGTITISPAIVSAGGGTDAEKQYQNVDSTPADGAALVWLNTVAANVNPFWKKESMLLLPGKFDPAEDSGLKSMVETTESGITMVMSRDAEIKTMDVLYRLDIYFGTVMLQPEMAGIMLFSQT